MNTINSYQWRIAKLVPETHDVTSLYLEPITEKLTFIAGQYLTIQIPNIGPVEGKAYSISNAPHETLLRISVKKMGGFSTAILAHKVGDTISTSAPYGFFYPELSDTTELAFVVGGIGIAPCLSIIKHLTHINDDRPIHLFYSNRTVDDIAFKTELDTLAKYKHSLSVHYYLTRETETNYKVGRVTPEQILNQLPNIQNTEIFLCGAMDFTKSLWRGLRDAGLPPHQIYTEGFF
ncbi:MAG: hypothetical protein RLZZ230_372 [Candidatus Parcubacteria bacterium]|jgi:ferredoxin-NADP reductase